jgi:hypothetical protein
MPSNALVPSSIASTHSLTGGRRKSHVFQTKNTKKDNSSNQGDNIMSTPKVIICHFLELPAGTSLRCLHATLIS